MAIVKKLILITLFLISSIVYADDFDGGQSTKLNNDHYIEVGKSNIWVPTIHSPGYAGIGVRGGILFTFEKVDFNGITHNSSHTQQFVDKGQTVFHNSKGNGYPKHSEVGGYNFIKIGDNDLWVGEWSYTGAAAGWNYRQVYYVGNTKDTSVPTVGTATYKVYGVNRFTGKNLLEGNFDVDFANRKISGEIANNNLSVYLGDDVNFNANSPKFTGSAVAVKGDNDSEGRVEGRFYGANAASLAGLAQFDKNRNLDTSFGGLKNK